MRDRKKTINLLRHRKSLAISKDCNTRNRNPLPVSPFPCNGESSVAVFYYMKVG